MQTEHIYIRNKSLKNYKKSNLQATHIYTFIYVHVLHNIHVSSVLLHVGFPQIGCPFYISTSSAQQSLALLHFNIFSCLVILVIKSDVALIFFIILFFEIPVT